MSHFKETLLFEKRFAELLVGYKYERCAKRTSYQRIKLYHQLRRLSLEF